MSTTNLRLRSDILLDDWIKIKNNIVEFKKSGKLINLKFDNIFYKTNNEEIFNKLFDRIHKNICINLLFYGSSSSGKSYSTFGSIQTLGILHHLIKKLQDLSNDIIKTKTSFIEIYNDKIYDLLGESDNPLKLVLLDRVVIKDLSKIETKNDIDKIMNIIDIGLGKRKISKTKINKKSSRSHAIFMIDVLWSKRKITKIRFIDLCGSEFLESSLNNSETLSINKSLSELGRVFNAFNMKKKPNFRNSTLTKILSDTLKYQAINHFIFHIRPEQKHRRNSLNTLDYAKMLSNIPKDIKEDKSIVYDGEGKSINEEEIKDIITNNYNEMLINVFHRNKEDIDKIFGFLKNRQHKPLIMLSDVRRMTLINIINRKYIDLQELFDEVIKLIYDINNAKIIKDEQLSSKNELDKIFN